MKHLFLLLLISSLAFSGNTQSLYGGISLGYAHYRTFWYYYPDDWAAHSTNRLIIAANLEKEAIWEAKNFRLDLGGELLLSPMGKTRATYLPGDAVIASGGWAAGIYPHVRAVYLPSSTSDVQPHPFVSLGPQYMFLHNNGKGSSYDQEYGYTDGWNEGVLQIAASLGVDLHLESFILTPELRFGLLGWSSTSWEPHGRDVSMNGGPGLLAFSLRLSKKF